MTMALTFRHLPPEIEAARQTLRAAYRDTMPTRLAWLSRVLLFIITLAIGAVIGSLLVKKGIVSPTDKEFWRSGITAISVLSGFMITTMVFTGKIDVAKSLSVTELREISAKANHLLLYQFGTLANHLFCLLAMFLLPPIATKWLPAAETVAVFCLSFFFVSIIRSAFIPLQIIELHRFTHAALLRDKRDEIKKESEKI